MDEITKPYVIGLDLGGTNSVFGIVDARGNIVATTAIKTQAYPDFDDYVKASVDALMPIIDTVGGIEKIKALGIGAPNGNYYNGTIEYAANLVWQGVVPIAKKFEEALGVGSGIYINGQLVLGCDGLAGELGHLTVVPGGRTCGCGRKGCLETYCSATGVARTAREYLDKRDTPSLLRDIKPVDITSFEVYKAAVAGDELAKEIFEVTGSMLGEACANFALFCSPEAFIFMGGLTKAGDLLMKPLQKAYDEHVLSVYKGKAKLMLSGLKDSETAVLGASALGWDNPPQPVPFESEI